MRDFALHRPASVSAATAAFAGTDGEAAYLAGGHTLIPAMKSRLRMPDALVDLTGLGLSGISRDGDRLWIGATTLHADVASGATAIPGLACLAAGIGDAQVRNRGTIGGSVANNDPAADYPGAVMGLNGTIVTNKRSIKADDYFLGLFETALERDEIITSVRFPIPERAAYQKFRHPASGYAVVGVMVSKSGANVRVGVTGAGPCAFRMSEMEAALAKSFTADAIKDLKGNADDLLSDIHSTNEYRAHLVGVLARRAVAEA